MCPNLSVQVAPPFGAMDANMRNLPSRTPTAMPTAVSTSTPTTLQWTAQDVERFREQQRWRMRHQHSYTQSQSHSHHQQASPARDCEPRERPRKLSARSRQQQQQQQQQQQPSVGAAVPMAESPVALAGLARFNAFDWMASPEGFAHTMPASPPRLTLLTSNQDDDANVGGCKQSLQHQHQHQQNQDQDMDMNMDMSMNMNMDDGDGEGGSLWRRRFPEQRRSPKLARAALWAADWESNQALDQRSPLRPRARR